jgi:phenylacetic acid degradation operon negative regulatory protein
MRTALDVPQPVLSRRREVGEASSRSLLMTLLGEFVLPRDGAVWTSALIRALAMFEVEEKSARQALARVGAEGWLTAQRQGRRVRWELTDAGRGLLTHGAERIYSFGREQPAWDHTWLVLVVTVPETKRELRHRLRTRLSWAGFGSPSPGVWITPDASREAEARQILDELGLATGAMSFRAGYGSIGSPESVAAQAWDLAAVAARYEAFIAEFGGLEPGPGDEALIAATRLVHEWRRFPFLDPQLPGELLPAHWIGSRAARLFHARHAAWAPPARLRWEALMTEEQPQSST